MDLAVTARESSSGFFITAIIRDYDL
nr:MAG: hypothetical protein [Bacteriophage sp.]